MNLTLTNLNIATRPKAAAMPAPGDATAAAPVQEVAAIDGGALPAAAQPALAFSQWLGLEQQVPVFDAAASVQETALPATEAPAEEKAAGSDTPLLGAMAMPLPLMPVAQATLAAVAAALPGVPAAKETAPAADTELALPVTPEATRGAAAPVAIAQAAATAAGTVPAAPATLAAPLPANGTAGTAGAANAAGSATAAAPFGEALASAETAGEGVAAAEHAPAGSFGVAAPATGSTQRGADTVTLSGPPTAWRQSLQEALGERLQLQVGRGAEQAVIKLEPPMLGRVEIAIRHSAGALEVHISATHGEVLRQLQSVSENLRNDLAQRQFTDVAVNVAPAPRSASAAQQQFAGDTGGRGRQQDGREQEQAPGNALAEAHTGASSFSLNGRA